MRRTATPAEATLWRAVRSGQLGHKVRRQVPLGPYILDFAIVASRLVLEIDGDTHAATVDYDDNRTEWLRIRGWRVIRFTNAEVMGNRDGVLAHLLRVVNPHSHPNPLPTGEGAALEPSPIGRGQGEGTPPARTITP